MKETEIKGREEGILGNRYDHPKTESYQWAEKDVRENMSLLLCTMIPYPCNSQLQRPNPTFIYFL
jgi:hypothetical protein